ncbi:hypothetical protein AC579_3107 [Pseudocercospora musae]|uniref:KAR9-domain-containing protein n=1 Tax=Pseudocercospora musae TaxID=113226 RepID=A0A139IBQ4_9PEZI|nr:hypothetical protein AC579_3107 [Pseudocercospora musae]
MAQAVFHHRSTPHGQALFDSDTDRDRDRDRHHHLDCPPAASASRNHPEYAAEESQSRPADARHTSIAANTAHPRPAPASTPTFQGKQNFSRPFKRLAPALEARLQKLQHQRRHKQEEAAQRRPDDGSIACIPQQQRRQLERRALEVPRTGNAWAAWQIMPHVGGGVRLSGGPVLTDNAPSSTHFESDADYLSSVIDISDALGPSDTEHEELKLLQDKHKYRLPDCGKTRLHLRTKEPLSPGPIATALSTSTNAKMSNKPLPPVPPPNGATSTSTPTTPSRTTSSSTIRGAANENGNGSAMSPGPSTWYMRNGSVESLGDGEVRSSLSRAGSVYTLGRASFTGQLAQLTSMRLPDADSLAKRISALPTSTEAAKALADASEQIRMWIAKASDVLEGLNAEDDVEWAAAGGREGIEHVDKAINRFEQLVEVYIIAIENLQTRDDIASLPATEITKSMERMENIVTSWKKIKDTLNEVKVQVEIAMDWQRLWDNVLGDIAQEMEGLHRLVFEMEEARHNGSESVLSNKESIDISELETIVEDQPGRSRLQQNRLSLAAVYANGSMTPPQPPAPQDKEDASLLALFARMQPLRASLDFLPMRLSTFHIKGKPVFPSACIDLDQRRDQLEAQWAKLEADANSLRSELGEDRWVAVFRNAGRQALKMEESITRSFTKLKDALSVNEQEAHPHAMQNKIENYEQKKRHYGPAIERVLAIIDRGVTDRLTANGEILRLQSEMKRRWTALQAEMHDVDVMLEDIKEDLANAEARDKNLRYSVSTVISSERSVASSLGVDTPGSSPASSVIAGATSQRGSFGSRTPTPLTHIKLRSSSAKTHDKSSLTPSSIPRRTLFTKRSLTDMHSSHRSPSSIPTSTPSKQPAWPARPDVTPANKPRFQSNIKTNNNDFKPLSAYEPSPYAKQPTTPKHNYLRSGLGQSVASASRVPPLPSSGRISSAPGPTSSIPRSSSSTTALRKSSLPVPPIPSQRTPCKRLSTEASAPALRVTSSGRRSSMMPRAEVQDGNEADSEAPAHQSRRPPSVLATASGRRSSMLSGRRSRLSEARETIAGAERPKWRP